MMFTSVCPIMPSADFTRTKDFYARFGFTLGSEYPEQGYLILYRDQVELHFFRHPTHDPATSDHAVFIRVKDAMAVSDELMALDLPTDGIPRVVPAEPKPWGVCELHAVDHDGNLLRMGHIL